jgi:hypothetical protein
MRSAVFVTALAFTLLLLFLTVYVLVTSGPDLLTVASLLVSALFVFGVLGAFLSPPDGPR